MKFEEDGYSMFCCLHWDPLDIFGSASLSASTSSVLVWIASAGPGGLLSASPGGSGILIGLVLLLLVFLVDTISN